MKVHTAPVASVANLPAGAHPSDLPPGDFQPGSSASIPDSPSRGRPSGFTDEAADRLCAAIRECAWSDSVAAVAVGLSAATISRWKQKDPAFALRLQQARIQFQCDRLAVIKEGRRGWRAHAWLLQHHFPEQYGSPARRRRAGRKSARAESPSHISRSGSWNDPIPGWPMAPNCTPAQIEAMKEFFNSVEPGSAPPPNPLYAAPGVATTSPDPAAPETKSAPLETPKVDPSSETDLHNSPAAPAGAAPAPSNAAAAAGLSPEASLSSESDLHKSPVAPAGLAPAASSVAAAGPPPEASIPPETPLHNSAAPVPTSDVPAPSLESETETSLHSSPAPVIYHPHTGRPLPAHHPHAIRERRRLQALARRQRIADLRAQANPSPPKPEPASPTGEQPQCSAP